MGPLSYFHHFALSIHFCSAYHFGEAYNLNAVRLTAVAEGE